MVKTAIDAEQMKADIMRHIKGRRPQSKKRRTPKNNYKIKSLASKMLELYIYMSIDKQKMGYEEANTIEQ